jgi:hypothetical protein
MTPQALGGRAQVACQVADFGKALKPQCCESAWTAGIMDMPSGTEGAGCEGSAVPVTEASACRWRAAPGNREPCHNHEATHTLIADASDMVPMGLCHEWA